jgi:hypothetical protein
MQFLDFDVPLPDHIRPPPMVNLRNPLRYGIVQWELEILAREIVLNGEHHSKKNLERWGEVAREINSIKFIENNLWGLNENAQHDILHELVRISHRQFPWQKGVNQPHIARYSRLYESPGLHELIQSDFQMSYNEMAQIGLALSGHFVNNFSIVLPIKNRINAVSAEICSRFIERFSCTIDELKNEYRNLQQYNINWAYTLNPLRQKPIVRVAKDLAICPIPVFLLRRMTNELYFDLVKSGDAFSRSFGPAVQKIIGEIAESAGVDGRLRVIPECRYGTKSAPKDTVDWIVEDETASLFVECKGARVRYQGISDLTDHKFIDGEFVRIKEFLFQTYRTLNDALDGQYPQWKPRDLPVYPMIVTLEDWQTLGIHVERLILAPLRVELDAVGIDSAIVDRHPPSFCAMDAFEIAMRVCEKTGINEVFAKKNTGEYPQWALDTFLYNQYGDIISNFKGSVLDGQWRKIEQRLGSGAGS